MESQEIEAICTERLGRWRRRLVEEHSTPVFLLGAGHDHKIGQVVLCTLEEMSDSDIADFLYGALNKFVLDWKSRAERRGE